MAAGTMFSNIKYFKDPAWGKSHPYFEVASTEKRYLYEVLSANVLYGESGAEFSYWRPNKGLTMNKEEYLEYLQQIKNYHGKPFADIFRSETETATREHLARCFA